MSDLSHTGICTCTSCARQPLTLTVWIGGVRTLAELDELIRVYVDEHFRPNPRRGPDDQYRADIGERRVWEREGYGAFVITTDYDWSTWLSDSIHEHDWSGRWRTFGGTSLRLGPLAVREGDCLTKLRGQYGVSVETLKLAEAGRRRAVHARENQTAELYRWFRPEGGKWTIGVEFGGKLYWPGSSRTSSGPEVAPGYTLGERVSYPATTTDLW